MNKVYAVAEIASAVFFAGCISNRVAWMEGETPELPEKTTENYRVERASSDSLHLNSVLKRLNTSEANALSISYTISRRGTASNLGAVSTINNFFSCCTLGIWPFVLSEIETVGVHVSGYGVSGDENVTLVSRSWSSFLLPICALPCPGWGDWRGSPSVSSSKRTGQSEWENSVLAATVVKLAEKQGAAMRAAKDEQDRAMLKKNEEYQRRKKEAIGLLQKAIENSEEKE